jgi:homoserine O-acetyltransferase
LARPTDHVFELGDLELELGGKLPDATLAYRTHGTLSDARDNVVLFPHMYSGTPSSLDTWIEPGRPLDPGRWFVVCPGQLGSGVGTSPSTASGDFPALTIGDDVAAQRRLVDALEIERLELVVGFSMGAQQAYEWAVRFPHAVARLAAFAGLARTTPWNDLVVAAAENALRSGGLVEHARFWAATALSPAVFREDAWRKAGFSSVEDLLRRLFDDDFAARDPADLICQLGKWRRADVSRHAGGDLPRALARVAARTIVAPFSTDALFPVADCDSERRLVPDAELRVIESPWGHYAWGMTDSETAEIDGVLAELLATATSSRGTAPAPTR